MNDQPANSGCSSIKGDPSPYVGAETPNNSNTTSPMHIRSDSSPMIILDSFESNGASSKSSFDDAFSDESSSIFYESVGKYFSDV